MPPKGHETDLRSRLSRACAEIEGRLRSGEAVRAEDYFAADPALASDTDSALELIYAEFVTRGELGPPPSPGEWYARFPRWDKDLRDLIQIHELMKEGLDEGLLGAPVGDPEWTPGSYPYRLGHCELLEEVGRGAMGVVYKARDLNLRRLVALKMVRPAAQADTGPNRFRAEAEAVARLQHPNIVQIYEIFEVAGRSFISLELIEGGSLKQALIDGPQAPRPAAALLEVVARAIAYAHRRGVVHQDLKPANVLLTTDGVPKVVDFGLAKQLAPDGPTRDAGTSARRSAILGTPGYMAPEQFGGALAQDGLLADVYALGAILYELLTGRTTRGMESYFEDLLIGAARDPTPPSQLRPEIPRDLDAICVKCLHGDPARRYPDAGALAEDLRRFLAGEPVQARPIGTWEWCWKSAKRRPAAATLATVGVLAVVSLLVGSVWYNARLSFEARKDRHHRDEVERQAGLLRDQLDVSRRSLYALQLTHVEASHERNPGLGRALLNDVRYCPEDLRDFTWGYFLRLCERKRLHISTPRLGLVNAVAFSPDGRVLAIAGAKPGQPEQAGQVKLLDPATAQELGSLDEPLGPVDGIAFSPDGRTLATASGHLGDYLAGVVRLWDVDSTEELFTIDGLEQSAPCVAFRPDSLELATAGADGVVQLWDARTGRPRADLRGDSAALRGIAYSPRGDCLATGGDDGTIRLWEVGTGWAGPPLKGHSARVNAVAFSPDGRLLASAGADKLVILWELAGRHPRSVLRGHLAAVQSVAFSPDGATLITGGEECIVRLWRVDDGREVTALNIHNAPVSSVAFAPAGDVFASGSHDRTAKLWDLVPGRQRPPLTGHEAKVVAAVFTPDGSTLITAGRDSTVRLRDVADGQVRTTLRDPDHPVKCLALTFGRRLLAAGGGDGSVRLWDLVGGRPRVTLGGHAGEVTSVAFSPVGDRLASASLDATVRLWDVTTGQCLAVLPAHEGGAYAVAFSPDGKVLATAGADKLVKLWRVADWRELASFKGHDVGVLSLAFHPDGKTLATGGKDRLIRLWDVASLKERAKLWGHNHWVYSIVFSPDGRTMASSTGDPGPNAVGEVKLWDAATGHVRATFQGQTTPVAFSADGRALLTGNHDETVNLLEVAPEFRFR